MPALDGHHSYPLLRRSSDAGMGIYAAIIAPPVVVGITFIMCIIACCRCHHRDKRIEKQRRLLEREAAVQRDEAAARAIQQVELRGGDTADDEAIARALAEAEVAPAYAPAVEGGTERGVGRDEGDVPPAYEEAARTRL